MSINTHQKPRKLSLLNSHSLNFSFSDVKKESIAQLSKDVSKTKLHRKMEEEFQAQQRSRRERQLRALMLGKGLGERAEMMIFNGFYKPQITLERNVDGKQEYKPCDSSSNNTSTLDEISLEKKYEHLISRGSFHSRNSKSEGVVYASYQHTTPSTSTHSETKNVSSSCAEKFNLVDSSLCGSGTNFHEVCGEVGDRIAELEHELDMLCVPYGSFNFFLNILSQALEFVEEGNLEKEFAPFTKDPETQNDNSKSSYEGKTKTRLVGAENVMQYVLDNMIELSFELVPVTHTAQWVLQFTIAFLRSLIALTEEDAHLRLELLARCVHLLGITEHFSATLLTLTFLIEEYDAFYQLTDSVTKRIEFLFKSIEDVLNGVLAVPFPLRRAKLRKVDKFIHSNLKQLILFINELDSSWRPTIYFHMLWKDTFLSKCFFRIHKIISQRYVFCSYGFVDEVLYTKIYDSRIDRRFFGTVLSPPQLVLARKIEYERVTEGLSFEQIGMSAKRYSSVAVGYQICMGARYVLRQATPEFDKAWGFAMNEPSYTLARDGMDSLIMSMMERMRKDT